ncbi:MAG: hypothetical protein ABWZ74_03680 [Hyphomicrobiaceae bacterium]
MPGDHKTNSGPAKPGEVRRDRLATELRSNLHKRKARARSLEKLQDEKPDSDKVDE